MFKQFKFSLVLPLSAALLWGCSSGEDLYAPAEVPEIENRFSPDTLWSDSVGGVGDFYSSLSPAFAAGTVYAAGRDGDVYAIESADGDKIWHTDLDDEDENDGRRSARLSGGVSAYAGKVAVGSENGYIYVLNAIDGSLLWKAYVGSEVVSKPAFSRSADKVFVYDSRGRLTAFDLTAGKELWVSGESTSGLRLRSQADPIAVGDEYVVLGQSSGRISVIAQDSGAIVNQITVSESGGANSLERIRDVSSTPLLLGDTLYTTSYNGGYAAYSFALQNFVTRLGYNSSKAPALDDSSLVIVEDDGHVVCINRADNSERWSVNNLYYRNLCAPVIYGDYVVVGDFEGYLYFISLANGSIDCIYDLDSSGIYTAPLQADGHLYVQSRDGSLYCLHYDPRGSARAKELALQQAQDYAGVGVSLARPGVGSTGIYAPDDLSYEELMARRQSILRMAAAAEAQQRAVAAQRRAYEQRRAEYEARMKAIEEAERERVSGFGLMPGVKSDAADTASPVQPEPPAQDSGSVQAPVPEAASNSAAQQDSKDTEPSDAAGSHEKAAGFGL